MCPHDDPTRDSAYWIPPAARFFREFDDLFDTGVRGGATQRHGREYLTGLVLPLEDRKSAENLAERLQLPAHRLHHFLAYAPWDHRLVQTRLAEVMGRSFSSAKAVLALDDTEVAKQGDHSVGVAPPYCGSLGKVANCQAAVSVQYVLPDFTFYPNLSSFLVGMELYLPEAWTRDPTRRERTFVPKEVEYQPKWRIGLELVDRCRLLSLTHRAVVADAGYGAVAEFRRELRRRKEPYLVGLQWSNTTRVRVGGTGPVRRVDAVGKAIPKERWTRVRWAEGSKGPLEMEVARVKVAVVEGGETTEERGWLIFEQRTNETKAYLAWGLDTLSLVEQLRVMRSRFPIEQSYQQMKEELGLDHFEGRSWRGWHHHVTMVGMAQGFLMLLRRPEAEEARRNGPKPRRLPTVPKVRKWLNSAVAARFVRKISEDPKHRVSLAVHMAQLLGAPIGMRNGKPRGLTLKELAEEG